MCIRDRSYAAEMNLNIKQFSGENDHHIIEAAFKAFAKALDEATTYDRRLNGDVYKRQIYAASKSMVLSFSRALNRELEEKGITVTAVCPGPVQTEFFDVAQKYTKSKPYKMILRADPVLSLIHI